jgi:hypothetical protein
MSSYEPDDENHPPFGFTKFPQKPRPVGVYSKSPEDNVDLKAIISSPYGLNMGKVGLGIAEGMVFRRSNRSIALDSSPFPRNLVRETYRPWSSTPNDTLSNANAKRTDLSVKAGRRRTVLRKPITKSRNISPTRLPTRSKVAQKVTGNKTRSSRAPRLPHPTVRKRTTKHTGTVDSDSGVFRRSDPPRMFSAMQSSLSTSQRPSSLSAQPLYRGSNLIDTDPVSSFVPSLPTIIMIHPSTEQYESLLKSAPSLEALVRSHSSREFQLPSFGSVKQRVKEPDIFSLDASATSSVMSDSAASTQGTKRNISVEPSPDLGGQITTESNRHESKFGSSAVKSSQGWTQKPSETLSTMALDVFGIQTDGHTSLLCSTRSFQDLIKESSRLPPVLYDQRVDLSLDYEDSQTMSPGSVKFKPDFCASIATSAASPEISSRSLLASQTIDDANSSNDVSIWSSDSQPVGAITPSTTVNFAHFSSLGGGTAKTKHERLLAAILDTVPPSPDIEKSLPSIVVSREGDQQSVASPSPTLQSNRRSINVGVPAIVITDSLESVEHGLPSCSSSFSIIDLYVGRPEMPCLGPLRNKTNSTTRLPVNFSFSDGVLLV